MDKKIYEKTRYQNIWRHKKNKNYVIDISKPIKTSISKVDDVKIFDINVAIKVRDSYNTSGKISERGTVTTFWNKYLYDCQYVKKLKKNTMKKLNCAQEYFVQDAHCKLWRKVYIRSSKCLFGLEREKI